MPHSHSSSEAVLPRLRAYLAETVPSAAVDEAKTAPGYAPLVLLRARYMIAGFGISNGNIGKSYESLYRGFKTYYSHKHKELDDLDLALCSVLFNPTCHTWRASALRLKQMCTFAESLWCPLKSP